MAEGGSGASEAEISQGQETETVSPDEAEKRAQKVVQGARDQNPSTGLIFANHAMFALAFLVMAGAAIHSTSETSSNNSSTPSSAEQVKNQNVLESSIQTKVQVGSNQPDQTWIANTIHAYNNYHKVDTVGVNPYRLPTDINILNVGSGGPMVLPSSGTSNEGGELYIVTDQPYLQTNTPDKIEIFLDNNNPLGGKGVKVDDGKIQRVALKDLSADPTTLAPNTGNLEVIKIERLWEWGWLDAVEGGNVDIHVNKTSPSFAVERPGGQRENMPGPKSSVTYKLSPPTPPPGTLK